MRRPVAVFPARPQRSDLLARHESSARLQSLQTFTAQVSVKRVERAAVNRVLENDGRAVVAGLVVDFGRMNAASQWGEHFRSSRRENIEAEVDGARFLAY